MVRDLESYEEKAISLIKAEKCILQSELWKRLSLDSREGSRLVQRLLKRGAIKREEATINGKRTFRICIDESTARTAHEILSTRSIMEIPCITCPSFAQCYPGAQYEPGTCALMDMYVKRLVKLREGRYEGDLRGARS